MVLTVLLRSSTKIVRATVAKEDKDVKAEGNEKKKVLKMLCYDTTSWVKENFEPQVRMVCGLKYICDVSIKANF